MNAPSPNPNVGDDNAASTGEGPHTVQAALTFIVPQDGKPYFESSALTGGAPRLFFQTEDHVATIRDMRPLAGDLSIDRQGFELHTRPTAVADLYDDEMVARDYEAEIIALLQQATGADQVVVFDYTRRSDGAAGAANPDGLRGPAGRVHVDYTPLT
ncbi:MAG: CmcJ/NvfI family oxidoreductase [Proteobacteria bacterium]|nr:CmcJ/NvfI family oxidoreductase [Pseudomonadota bacterium]